MSSFLVVALVTLVTGGVAHGNDALPVGANHAHKNYGWP